VVLAKTGPSETAVRSLMCASYLTKPKAVENFM